MMIDAIYKAHDVNQTLIAFINQIVAEVGKEKHSYTSCAVPEELFAAIGCVRRKRWKKLFSQT